MARLPRTYSETGLYFVTARTFQSRFLLTPGARVNEVLAGVLAKAAAMADIQLHAYVALSNHVHLLVTARGNSLSRFMQYFLGNAARKLGRLVQWSGSFWHRRFSAEPVLDDEAAVGRLRYLLSHGVKEGLVRTPEEWPGLSCLKILRNEEATIERFFHWEHRWRKGVLVEGGDDVWDERWAEEVPLTLAPLPCWGDLSFEERQRRLQSLLDDIIHEWAPSHEAVKGAEAVQGEDPHRRPLRTKKSPRPLCHVSTKEGFLLFRERLRAWVVAFAHASARFRQETGTWSFRRGRSGILLRTKTSSGTRGIRCVAPEWAGLGWASPFNSGELVIGAKAQPASSSRARSAPPPPGPGGGASVLPNYGRSKGAPIRGASQQDLEYYAAGARRSLADLSKERFHDKGRALLAGYQVCGT